MCSRSDSYAACVWPQLSQKASPKQMMRWTTHRIYDLMHFTHTFFEVCIELFKNRVIIQIMRRIFLLVMIALLPLRGMATDIMATQMFPVQSMTVAHSVSQQDLNAIDLVATDTINTRAGIHFEHKNVDALAAAACHGATDQAEAEETNACSACQTCHSSLFISSLLLLTHVSRAVAQPLAAASQWVNADLPLAVKPPVI